jgi:hypothetical protein
MMSEQEEQFRKKVEELVARFEKDVDTREWVTRRYPKRMRDRDGQVFEVPALYLQKGPTRLLLDPIGDDVPGAEATLDLYLMPAYDPTVSVYFESGQWVIYTSFPSDSTGVPGETEFKKLPLTAETINQVLDSIAAHAVS